MPRIKKDGIRSQRPPKKTDEDLTQKAHNAIRKMMLFNELAIGQKIHYQDIAEKLSMSPTPVIQALKWLQFQGLVRHENNRGFYLEDVSIEEVDQLYEVRRSVELAFLDRAIVRPDDTGIAQLEASLDELLDAIQRKLPMLRIVKDVEFHMTLASLAGGRPARLILQHIFDLLYLKYRTAMLMLRGDEEGHRRILECVAARDRDGAREVLDAHITGVAQDVVRQLRAHMEEKEALNLT
jgi:DNA-binding GntR family transcriptional regulator